MGYAHYAGSAASRPVSIIESISESAASGLRVGRLDLWPVGQYSIGEVRQILLESIDDVIIVRYPSSDYELAAGVQAPGLRMWQADTLLYFERELTGIPQPDPKVELKELTLSDEDEADSLISAVFDDYANHWSATPELSGIDIVTAYQDWTRRCIQATTSSALVAVNDRGDSIGICVVDDSHDAFEEILLAGTLPRFRRMGLYQQMVAACLLRASSESKTSVVISTQASNIAVMRAWCRMGFLPTISLNTLHVVR